MNDLELIQALNGRQRQNAMKALFERYAQRFKHYCQQRGWDAARSEDAVQEAFVRIIRSAPNFQAGTPEQARAWLWQLARSAWADMAKSRAWTLHEEEDSNNTESIAQERAQDLHYEDCIEGQLSRFNAAYPEAGSAISWAAVDGLSGQEIAKLLGRSAGATREFLSKARKRLKQYLEPCLGL